MAPQSSSLGPVLSLSQNNKTIFDRTKCVKQALERFHYDGWTSRFFTRMVDHRTCQPPSPVPIVVLYLIGLDHNKSL
jgi:hypothetical protein